MTATEIDILLVEDTPDDADLAMRILRREHPAISICIAKDGEEALDFLFCRGQFTERSFEHPPKLVLLDLKLPKVDGIEVLEQIKTDARTRAIPVVVLTSSREERDLTRSYDRGANSYVQKPVNFEQFKQMVKILGLYWMVINQRDPLTERQNRQCKGQHDAIYAENVLSRLGDSENKARRSGHNASGTRTGASAHHVGRNAEIYGRDHWRWRETTRGTDAEDWQLM